MVHTLKCYFQPSISQCKLSIRRRKYAEPIELDPLDLRDVGFPCVGSVAGLRGVHGRFRGVEDACTVLVRNNSGQTANRPGVVDGRELRCLW